MRAYFVSVMVVSTIALAITGLTFSNALLSFVAPESSLSKSVFAKYNQFDHYVEITKMNLSKKQNNESYKNLTQAEWEQKWKRYRLAKISAEKHDGVSELYSSTISFFIFGLLMFGNFLLYKKIETTNTSK